MTSGPCERPCANPTGGGGAAILPSELSIDVLPTRINYVPVIVVDAPPSGSATVRSSWPRPGV
jgi:hypothetical protein